MLGLYTQGDSSSTVSLLRNDANIRTPQCFACLPASATHETHLTPCSLSYLPQRHALGYFPWVDTKFLGFSIKGHNHLHFESSQLPSNGMNPYAVYQRFSPKPSCYCPSQNHGIFCRPTRSLFGIYCQDSEFGIAKPNFRMTWM